MEQFLKLNNLFSISSTGSKNVCRIAIQAFGSPLWPSAGNSGQDERRILNFLHALRCLIRSCSSVCVMTVPSYLFPPSLRAKLPYLYDYVISLESFAGRKESKTIVLF